ncbi:MAG: class I SAM-dependent DNA methyltransferase [Acidobacteriota bacterium]
MSSDKTWTIRASYDQIAAEYTRRLSGELAQKPLDCQILDRFAAQVRGKGHICDLGCGPGQVARYLKNAGLPAFGIDLSPAMVAQARELHPDIPFREGNMLGLDFPPAYLGGIVSFYSIVHFPLNLLHSVFLDMARVIKPRGMALVAFHLGKQVEHRDEMWGETVSLDFHFFQRAAVVARMEQAGFIVQEIVERGAYAPEVEYQSRRAYVLALRP